MGVVSGETFGGEATIGISRRLSWVKGLSIGTPLPLRIRFRFGVGIGE